MVQDSRKTVGAQVNTLATSVTNTVECRRLFGASFKSKRVNGIVKKVTVTQPASGRASTTLEVGWDLTVNGN